MIRGTVHDNLIFPFQQRAGENRVFAEQDARDFLGRVGLDHVPFDRDVLRLSGGERHRLALVRALLWDPPVLVADEVLSGLDSAAAEACLELLMGFAKRQGRVVFLVLHDPALFSGADPPHHQRPGPVEES